MSNAEIAEALVASGATVKTHVKRIFSKLGVPTAASPQRLWNALASYPGANGVSPHRAPGPVWASRGSAVS
jgi:hypothetical protein